jgi:hypothetical protein
MYGMKNVGLLLSGYLTDGVSGKSKLYEFLLLLSMGIIGGVHYRI